MVYLFRLFISDCLEFLPDFLKDDSWEFIDVGVNDIRWDRDN